MVIKYNRINLEDIHTQHTADRIIVTTGGDHTSVEVIVGLIHTYRRDMQCSN